MTGTPAAAAAEPAEDAVFGLLADLTALLLRWSYEGVAGAERTVARVAAHDGARADVAFLADAAVLTVGDRTTSCAASPVVPPLHQVSRLKRLLAVIPRDEVPAGEAAARLAELRELPPRWRPGARVAGLTLFSVGFGISIQATWQEMVASAVLGLLVGVVVVATDRRPRLALVAPFACSVAVAALAVTAVRHGWVQGGPIQLMLPALFSFIPGDALSAAMLELAAGRITAGAARLVSGLAALLVLGFGALVASALLGVPADALFDADVAATLGPFAVWGGWVVFAVGVMLTFSMDPADFPWALALVLGTAAVTALAGAAAGAPAGTGVADMLGLLVAIGVGMLVGAALVPRHALAADT